MLNDSPENFLFYIICLRKGDEESQIKIISDDTEVETNFEEFKDKENSKFIFRVYYFKKNKSKKYFYVYYNKRSYKQNLNNFKNFIFKFKCFFYIYLSDYQQFHIFQEFVEKNNSITQLKGIFYNDCFTFCQKQTIDFIVYLETMEYYFKEDKNKNEFLFYFINFTEFEIININKLNIFEKKFIDFIENINLKQTNIINDLSKDSIEKGQIISMLYLYICLSYEKFVQYYNIVDENEKELIISLIHQNQTIEYIFIRNNIGKIIENSNNKDEVMSLINNCKYFSNFIELLIYFIKNPHKNKIKIDTNSAVYKVSSQDDITDIILKYKKIISIITLDINEYIWYKYLKKFNEKKDLKKLIELKEVIKNISSLFFYINDSLNVYFEKYILSNNEILDFINEYLITNISWMKGNINFNLFKYINFTQLNNDFIERFKSLKLKELFNKENYEYFIINLLNRCKNFKEEEQIFKLIDFDDNYHNSLLGEKILIDIYIKLYQLDEDQFSSLINIIMFLNSKSFNLDNLIEQIYLSFSYKTFIKIFSEILNKEIFKEEEILNKILKYFLDISLKYNQFEFILNITNNNVLKQIFNQKETNNFRIPIPEFNEFFLKYDTKAIIILNQFKQFNQLEIEELLIEEGYVKNVSEKLKEYQNIINEKEITLAQGEKILLLDNELENKLKLIFYKNKDDFISNKKEELINSIKKSKKIKEEITLIYNYLTLFSINNENYNDYQKYYEEINTKKIKDFHTIISNINKHNILLKEAEDKIRYKKSKIFMNIFNIQKEQKNENNPFDKTLLIKDQLINMLEINNISNNDNEIFVMMIGSFSTFNELKDEIRYLFEINNKLELYENILGESFEKIFLYQRSKELLVFVNTFYKFNLIFKSEQTEEKLNRENKIKEFEKEYKKLDSLLKEVNLISNFQEIKMILNKWDEKLFLEKQQYEIILENFFKNVKLIKFLKITKEDYSSFQDFIDPLESHISLKDFDELKDIIDFKDKLFYLQKSENFIKDLSEIVNKTPNIEKLLKHIKNINEKSNDLLELFTKKLNRKKYAEIKFENISKNGIFHILFDENGYYKCKVSSQINEEDDKMQKKKQKMNLKKY